MFRPRVLPLLAALFFFVSISNPSTLAASRTSTQNATGLPTDYASALEAADRFLQAWQSGDTENGIALLTSRAKEAASTDVIARFFSSSTPSAYEIGHGKLLKHGRYEFPVVLVGAAKNNHSRRRFSSIIVLHSGDNDWAVDKLP